MNSVIVVFLILTSFCGSYGSGLNGGSPVFCEKEGVEVDVPWISSDPCISCKCQPSPILLGTKNTPASDAQFGRCQFQPRLECLAINS
ncbi:hypothetical protein NPIL_387651 [Nephila pilipes]|uniref:Spider venom protein n=1 Tax=Nephila pilipes TaxID=299642 RepID=A0A8X6TA55_NEPPI|nr:hypothetical protein NPIL_387651 [Nephila pilipes]